MTSKASISSSFYKYFYVSLNAIMFILTATQIF